ncbi:hypothetical protein V3C99_017913, partial [Haemonchus contortus]
MSLHFHRRPIISNATTLKNLVVRYREYTTKVDYPAADEETYEQCRSAIALLESGIRQINLGTEQLRKLYSEIREEYQNCKNKAERKDIMLEIEQIEEDSNLHTILADANELGFMLTTRLDEAKCARDRLDVKLEYTTQKAQRLQELALGGEDQRSQINPDEGSEQGPSSQNRTPSVGVADETQSVECINPPRSCRSIRPPQASLPKFHGDAEDFPEFWAVFETLVHKSNELDVMEKILLLKESLVGKAQNSIKGIRLVPENYNWLV